MTLIHCLKTHLLADSYPRTTLFNSNSLCKRPLLQGRSSICSASGIDDVIDCSFHLRPGLVLVKVEFQTRIVTGRKQKNKPDSTSLPKFKNGPISE